MKISQHPQTGCTHTSRNYRDYRPDSPQTLRPDSICSFRDECDPSSRGARRPVPHTLVTGTQFVTSNTQGLGKLDFHVLGQRDLAPFDASDYLGRNLRSSAELRLGQPSQNAPVTREPLCDRHLNDVLDRDAQLGRHTPEEINLGRRLPGFPPSNGVSSHISSAGKFCLRDAQIPSGVYKTFGSKPAHNSSAHRQGLPRNVVITRHCAASWIRCAHNSANR